MLVWATPPALPEAEFKEFEPRLKFKPRLKYGWFHLNFLFNFLRFKPVLNWYRILVYLSRGLNSLNSDTGNFFCKSKLTQLFLNQAKYICVALPCFPINLLDKSVKGLMNLWSGNTNKQTKQRLLLSKYRSDFCKYISRSIRANSKDEW